MTIQTPSTQSGLKRFLRSFHFKRTWQCYLMLLLPAVFVFIFNYMPLYGLVIAFQDYNPAKGFLGSEWVGMKWFRMALSMPDFFEILRNTVTISLGKLIFSQIASVLFALLINEVQLPMLKRTVQTITYFPHFLSWVIIGGVFIDMLSTKGLVNQAIKALGGRPIFFLGRKEWFQPIMVILEVWKEFGYGAIIYLAAITSINPDLYEAATIDGANRLQQTWYVTLPGISVTIIMMVTLALGGIMNAGFDQIFVMYNASVYETADILDTFIYRQGLVDAQYSLSTAIGLFKSVIGAALLIATNAFATKKFNYRIF